MRAYVKLEQHRYDQIPTASNWVEPENFKKIVAFCRRRIHPSRLKGFLQTTWLPTIPRYRARHLQAIDAVAEVIAQTER